MTWMKDEPCATCLKMGPGVHWKDNRDKEPCRQCGKVAAKVLDTHHSRNTFCSLKCEGDFWTEIAF